MRSEEVLKLIDAGFTSEEIRKMMTEETPDAQEPKQEPKQESEAPAEDHTQPGLDAMTALNTILGKMNDKLDQIQRSNIINDASSAGTDKQSADDILQELIYPGNNK